MISIDTKVSIIKMLTKTQEDILVYLQSHSESELTIRGISRALNKSYTLVYNNLTNLEQKKIISKKNIPPGQIIRLNEYSPIDVLIEIEFKRKNMFLKEHPWIELMLTDFMEKFSNPFFIMLIFGSYAKDEENKGSDIDIMIILENKKFTEQIENIMNSIYSKAKKSIYIVDTFDIIEMIKNSNEMNIGNEAVKHHIILHGVELYYMLLKKAFRG